MLVPLVIWGGVTLILELGLQFGIRLIGYDYHGDQISVAYRALRSFGLLFTVNMGPLWFLRMLFILVLLSPLLSGGGRLVHGFRIGLFACAYACFELSGLEQGKMWNLLEYGFSLRGLLYFSVGIALRRYPIKVVVPRMGIVVICLAALALIWFQANVLVVVPIAMYAVYLVMPTRKIFGTQYSFPIYLLHMLVMLILTAALAALGVRSSTCHSMWLVIVRILVCLPVSIIIAYAMRRWSPRFAAVAFGGR